MGAYEEALQIVSAKHVEAAHAFVCKRKPGSSAERADKRPWCSCRNSARRGSLWQQCPNALELHRTCNKTLTYAIEAQGNCIKCK